jgi:hypothetical protein
MLGYLVTDSLIFRTNKYGTDALKKANPILSKSPVTERPSGQTGMSERPQQMR